MSSRHPLAAVTIALALTGGATALTACGDPAGIDRNDGVPDRVIEDGPGPGPDFSGRKQTGDLGDDPRS